MELTKEQAEAKIKELQGHIASLDKPAGYVIKNRYDDTNVYVSKADNVRGAVIEAVKEGANLWRADLGEANLWRADLGGANLEGANLEGANLWRANLGEANLGGANLGEANLREANLWRADLGGANLWRANLEGANLWRANLWRADLGGADLCGAKFYGKGGTSKLKREQVEDFLNALGFQIEDD